LNLRKYLVLLSVVVFGSIGDTFLKRGVGSESIDFHHLGALLHVLLHPFVILGILSLLCFMSSYMTALSFADLSYVLPATAVGYIFMTLLSIFWLHEHVSPVRWVGVLLIVIGVGAVAGGEHRTEHPQEAAALEEQR
jgi:drug/metabolite transporter (DMT)-like permease